MIETDSQPETASRPDKKRWPVVAAVALLIYVGTVVWTAIRPYTDSVPMVVPGGVEAKSAPVICSPVLPRSDGAPTKGSVSSEYPLSRDPCIRETERRVFVWIDLVVVGALLLALGRLRDRDLQD